MLGVKLRSSHQRCFVRKGALKNFAKFTGKHLCQNLFFNKVAGLRPETLLKKRLWHRCFPVNSAKFLRTPFLQNTSGRPLLKVDLSPRLATIDTALRAFQFKILNNVLFPNKKLYYFGITNIALCSFRNTLEETPINILFDWIHVKCLWERLQTKFQNDFILASLTLQATILRLYNEAHDNYNLPSHILLTFKYGIYISREK